MIATADLDAPFRCGEPVAIRRGHVVLPGTVTEVTRLGEDRWRLGLEVTTSFGVTTPQLIVDRAGLEIDGPISCRGLVGPSV
jgi:hypothetical protein